MHNDDEDLELFDCHVTGEGKCPGRSVGHAARCKCAFLAGHDGPHFCVWCRQKIETPALEPAIDLPRSRVDDKITSKLAAAKLTKYLGKIQAIVIDAFDDHGAMNDPELEEAVRDAGHDYAYSTARKRRGELEVRGIVRETGEIRHADERNSFNTGTSDSIVHELVDDWRVRVDALTERFPKSPPRHNPTPAQIVDQAIEDREAAGL